MAKEKVRRNGLLIMANLISLLGGFAIVMLLAIINGALGFISSIGITLFGSIGIAKILGEIGMCDPINIEYWVIIMLIVIFGVLRGALRYLEQYSNHFIAFKLLAILRDKTFRALRRLAPAKLESKQKGNIISLITADIETLEVFYAHTISPIAIAIIISLAVIISVGIISSWYLALLVFISHIFIAIFLPLVASKKMKKTGVEYRNEFASFNAYYLDSIKGIQDIVTNNGEKNRLKEVSSRSNSLLKSTKLLKKETSKQTALTELVVSLSIIAVTALGAVLTIFQGLDLGRMIISIVMIYSSFGPVIAISNLPSNLNQTFASGDRLLNLLEEKPIIEDVKNAENIAFENLQINDLTFGYSAENTVLEHVNMHVNKGEIVGIIGESGCGKSTLLKLLLRFYPAAENSISYNGISIENINTKSLLENVTPVFQSTYLFKETILENLKVAKEDASQDEIGEATRKASIDEFINNLENGYQTEISMMGDNISSGEKQRIGLARAFLRGNPLILLDEPTSNVDSMNEGIILKSLLDNKKDKSIILVSHRPSTMAICDRVYKFENKTLVEVKN